MALIWIILKFILSTLESFLKLHTVSNLLLEEKLIYYCILKFDYFFFCFWMEFTRFNWRVLFNHWLFKIKKGKEQLLSTRNTHFKLKIFSISRNKWPDKKICNKILQYLPYFLAHVYCQGAQPVCQAHRCSIFPDIKYLWCVIRSCICIHRFIIHIPFSGLFSEI